MKKKLEIMFLGLCILGIAGCTHVGEKQAAGTMLGAGVGGIIGYQFGGNGNQKTTTAIGSLVGALLGSAIGQHLDAADKKIASETAQKALEEAKGYETLPWRNDKSQNSGTFTPLKTFKKQGRYCREYRQTVNIGGQEEVAYGTACRQPDGQWQVISD